MSDKDDKKIKLVTEQDGTDDAGTKPERPVKLTYSEKIRQQYYLDPLDKRICEALYNEPTAGVRVIAALVGCSKSEVHRRRSKPAVIKRLNDMKATAETLWSKAEILGIRRMMQLAGSSDEFIALNASKYLASRMVNVARFEVNTKGTQTYEVQIGPSGEIVRSLRTADANAGRTQKTTTDLIGDVIEAEIANDDQGDKE